MAAGFYPKDTREISSRIPAKAAEVRIESKFAPATIEEIKYGEKKKTTLNDLPKDIVRYLTKFTGTNRVDSAKAYLATSIIHNSYVPDCRFLHFYAEEYLFLLGLNLDNHPQVAVHREIFASITGLDIREPIPDRFPRLALYKLDFMYKLLKFIKKRLEDEAETDNTIAAYLQRGELLVTNTPRERGPESNNIFYKILYIPRLRQDRVARQDDSVASSGLFLNSRLRCILDSLYENPFIAEKVLHINYLRSLISEFELRLPTKPRNIERNSRLSGFLLNTSLLVFSVTALLGCYIDREEYGPILRGSRTSESGTEYYFYRESRLTSYRCWVGVLCLLFLVSLFAKVVPSRAEILRDCEIKRGAMISRMRARVEKSYYTGANHAAYFKPPVSIEREVREVLDANSGIVPRDFSSISSTFQK